MLDFAAFLTCKPLLAAKDKEIIQACCDVLASIDRRNDDPLRLLDVGSGEASLVVGICNRFVELAPTRDSGAVQLVVDCVEPNPEGQTYLREFARAASGRGIQVIPHENTIEEFLSIPRADYDAVLCCHSLYHIKKEEWTGVLRGILKVLTRNGVMIVNLVSRSSDVYRILDHLPSSEIGRLPRTFESYGWLYFAEDAASVIRALDVDSSHTEISAPINFTPDDISEYSRYLTTGRGEQSLLLRFLAFMFRLRPEDLASVGKDVLAGLARNGQGLSFRSVDHLTTVRRRRP